MLKRYTLGPGLLSLHLCGIGCSTPDASPATTATASSSSAGATVDRPPAANSPLHVVLQSKTQPFVGALADGVWISEGPNGRVARAGAGGELESAPTPAGLPPSWARINYAAGVVNHVWLSVELADKGPTKLPVTPLYRFDGKEFRRIAEDWLPLITMWSGGRPLAVWRSGGRLKAKVPLRSPETPEGLPGSKLDDERCLHSLRLQAIAGLDTGEVFGLATCAPSGKAGMRSVVVQWPAPEPEPENSLMGPLEVASATAQPAASTSAAAAVASEPTASPSASAQPIAGQGGAAPKAARSATSPSAAPAPSSTPAVPTTEDPAAEGEPDTTARGHVMVLPGPDHQLSNAHLVARSAREVWVTGVDLESKPAPKSFLLRFDGTAWTSLALPTEDEVRGVAVTTDGTVWLATGHGIWKKTASGSWEGVSLPGHGESAEAAAVERIFALGDVVWVSARIGSGPFVVLRTSPAKEPIAW